MLTRSFGTDGLEVSVLGLGADKLGREHVSEEQAAELLNGALDAGVTLIDTARGYGISEERIGRHISRRRDEFVLSTKCGYAVPGVPDWTGPCITQGIEAALKRLQTDRIDIMHLHSCPLEVLERGEVIDALEKAAKAGKVRCAAYSGENEALAWATASGRFQSFQTSVNICDQRSVRDILPGALARQPDIGVIGKRPMANAFWRFAARPSGDYSETYWRRAKAMDLSPGTLAWDEFAIRYSAFSPGVSSIIVGTGSLQHLTHNAKLLAKGALPGDAIVSLHAAFDRAKAAAHDSGLTWGGEI